MQPWTVTFLFALAGTAIAMPAVEPAVEPGVDVADAPGSLSARAYTDCCRWYKACWCTDDFDGTRRAVDVKKNCKKAPTCDPSSFPSNMGGTSSQS
ncbi:hypothetical protein HOO65_050464 [Ceratocystis lukuohia]|uniref:Uncharacterized protein n=1 Tax=Ceratocystis lukuohia TaxID=2019550 RepID=A0ABR4MGB5_9PEZI